MTEPYSLDTILREFDENSQAWVLQDAESSKYVTIPHPKYPGHHPIHFFISKSDAQSMLVELIDENENLSNREIFAVQVPLLESLRNLAGPQQPGSTDSFSLCIRQMRFISLLKNAPYNKSLNSTAVAAPPPDKEVVD